MGTNKKIPLETSRNEWDAAYRARREDWQSAGLSTVSQELLVKYARGQHLLEIGCGRGIDAAALASLGFYYTGIDYSEVAVRDAQQLNSASGNCHFFIADFLLNTNEPSQFDAIYDKGVFHGLSGEERRCQFAEEIALALRSNGIWHSVCGCADTLEEELVHGAIFLIDIVAAIEPYFVVECVVRDWYGLSSGQDFPAWYIVARRR